MNHRLAGELARPNAEQARQLNVGKPATSRGASYRPRPIRSDNTTVRWTLSILLTLCCALNAVHAPRLRAAVEQSPRLLQLYDFEDTDDQGYKLGLGHDLPRHFFAIGRDPLVADRFFYQLPCHDHLIHQLGYPVYGIVHYDTEYKTSGDYSLKLACDGGNAGAFLEVGALAAVPGSDYRITARMRMADLHGAAAQLSACFIDATGNRIEGSTVYSPLLTTQQKWIDTSVTLTGEFPDAAWISLDVRLLQPTSNPDSALGKQQLIFHDVSASAWVDDVAVWQLPHVQVASESPVNVFRGPKPPAFQLTMRDLTGRRLSARVVVYDHHQHEVDRLERSVGAGAPTQWNWTANLPGYGWYLADLSIADEQQGESLARTLGAILWLPDEGAIFASDAARFTLAAEDLPAAERQLVGPLLDQTGLESVVLSIWDRNTTVAGMPQQNQELDDLLNRIISAQRTVTLSLHPLPKALTETEGVSASQALGVMQADPALWMPYLRPVMQRHGQSVRRWQLGRSDQAEAFFYSDPAAMLAAIRDQYEQMTPGPRLVVPWLAGQSRRKGLDPSYIIALDVPPEVAAEAMGEYLQQWEQPPPTRLALYLHEPPADRIDPQSRLDDLAIRMIEAWGADVESMVLTHPWTRAAERRMALTPDPLLGVFINTAHRLAGRRVVARDLPLGDGLKSVVLDGPGGGMIAAWVENAPSQQVTLRSVLGDDPVAIDLWGNRTPVPMIEGKQEVVLSDTPTFIEDIDPYLALFRAGFRIDQPFIESRNEPHHRVLRLTNPYPTAISGRLTVTGPADWDISPLNHVFSLAGGQSIDLPVVMRFPMAELAGHKRLTAHVSFDATSHYEVDLAAPMELGLPDVQFSAVATLEPGPDGRIDALLTAVVTNLGDRPRSLYLFAVMQNQPREERLVPELGPGQTMIKQMRFNGVDPLSTLRTGVREMNDSAMLNQLLHLSEAEMEKKP